MKSLHIQKQIKNLKFKEDLWGVTIQPQLYRGGWARSSSQEWGSRAVWFTPNARPVGSRIQGTSGSCSSVFPKSHLSLSLGVGLLLSTEQYSRVTVDQHFFLHSLSVGRKSTTCYWHTPSEGTRRQISQFCRDYRASWPCCGHCNVTVWDVSLTRSMRQPSLWFWQQGLWRQKVSPASLAQFKCGYGQTTQNLS